MIVELQPDTSRSAGTRSDRWSARLLSLALALLLVTFLVVDRSRTLLTVGTSSGGNIIEAGTVSLTDDDEGRASFDITDLVPGRSVANCIVVDYTGSVVPAEVFFLTDAVGPLVADLWLEVETGTGGRANDCAGFQPDASVYEGALPALPADGVVVDVIDRLDWTSTFRLTLGLVDHSELQGAAANLEFRWIAEPNL